MRPVQMPLNPCDGRFLRVDSGERYVVSAHGDRAAPKRSPIVHATHGFAEESAEMRRLGACRGRHAAPATRDMFDDLALAIVCRQASRFNDQIEVTGRPPLRTKRASHDPEKEWFRSFGRTWGGAGTVIADASDGPPGAPRSRRAGTNPDNVAQWRQHRCGALPDDEYVTRAGCLQGRCGNANRKVIDNR